VNSILNFIKTFIRVEFSFESGRSVDSITSSLNRTVKNLEDHAFDQLAKATAKEQKADDLYVESHMHRNERSKAINIAANIGKLLS
jgi:hypothetical protein